MCLCSVVCLNVCTLHRCIVIYVSLVFVYMCVQVVCVRVYICVCVVCVNVYGICVYMHAYVCSSVVHTYFATV